MSLSYGFYDSVNHDRTYNAEQFGKMFDGVILDGIFPQIGSAFAVTATSGLNFSVATGRAWFDHTWSLLEAAETMSVSTPDLDNPRIDTVVIEINKTSRTNSLAVVTGTPSSSPVHPELAHTEYVRQYPLADIYVPARAINLGAVTDRRGTNDCPYVRIVTDIAGRYVTSLNGETGDITGVKSFNGQTGVVVGVSSVNGQTGAVNLVTGVSSVNGQTGAISVNNNLKIKGDLITGRDSSSPNLRFTLESNELITHNPDTDKAQLKFNTGVSNIKGIILSCGKSYYTACSVPTVTPNSVHNTLITAYKLNSDDYIYEVIAPCGNVQSNQSVYTPTGIYHVIFFAKESDEGNINSNIDHTSGDATLMRVGIPGASSPGSASIGDNFVFNPYGQELLSICWDDNGEITFTFKNWRHDDYTSISKWYITILE